VVGTSEGEQWRFGLIYYGKVADWGLGDNCGFKARALDFKAFFADWGLGDNCGFKARALDFLAVCHSLKKGKRSIIV